MEDCKYKCSQHFEHIVDNSKYITGSDNGDIILLLVLIIIVFWLGIFIKHEVS